MAQKQPPRHKHVPQRTCVVCRQKTDKRQLTRLVRTPGNGVVVDKTGKQNGRGAYICNQPACWRQIVNNPRILNQALKMTLSAADLAVITNAAPTESPSA